MLGGGYLLHTTDGESKHYGSLSCYFASQKMGLSNFFRYYKEKDINSAGNVVLYYLNTVW
jgi:hypothetical protein